MAVCPQCGSDHIALARDTDINWGRAIAGWVLLGAVGAAVGGVTGKDRNTIACLDCGAKWRAADIYFVIQTIKNVTNINLDLKRQDHRRFVAEFIEYMTPRLEGLKKIEAKAALRRDKDVAALPLTTTGFFLGCVSIILLISVFKAPPWIAIIVFLFLVGLGLKEDIEKQAELTEAATKLQKKAYDESQKIINDARQEYEEWIRNIAYKKLSNETARLDAPSKPVPPLPPPPPPRGS